MLAPLLIRYNWELKPRLKGFLFKLLYSGKSVKVGSNFRCDTFPDLFITGKGKIEIGNNVTFRRNVDIRAHKHAKIVLGDNTKIDKGVRILATNKALIEIKKGAAIGCFSVLNGGDSISVGVKALVSGFVYLQTSMHRHESGRDIRDQGYIHKPVILGDDVWLGTHAVILPGCTINNNAIVGSNAVVNIDVEKGNVVAGVPARTIKERI